MPNIWATFARKLEVKDFQKSPNLVTLVLSQPKKSGFHLKNDFGMGSKLCEAKTIRQTGPILDPGSAADK